MRAALYETTGPSSVLEVREIDRPEPGPGEVRVRIEASGINPTDWKTRAGMTARPIDGFQVPHHDGVGVIDAVGEGVTDGRIGQRVWTYMAAFGNRWGTAAQWSVIPEDRAMPLAPQAPASLGACLGVPALTAHHCLFADGPVSGKTVLVAGGAGAVGHYAIELAKHAGAMVVTTVSGDAKAALAKAAGADVIVNYREEGAAERIREQAGQVDRIIEVDLTRNLPLDLAVLRPGGEIICFAAGPQDPTLPVRACMGANLLLRFVLLYGVRRDVLAAGAELISELVAAGKLTSLPTQEFALDDIAAAQDAVAAGATGKVLVIP